MYLTRDAYKEVIKTPPFLLRSAVTECPCLVQGRMSVVIQNRQIQAWR